MVRRFNRIVVIQNVIDVQEELGREMFIIVGNSFGGRIVSKHQMGDKFPSHLTFGEALQSYG